MADGIINIIYDTNPSPVVNLQPYPLVVNIIGTPGPAGRDGVGGASNAASVSYNPGGSGAVSSNVQAKLRTLVSVADYGATGSGNETTALVNACSQSNGGFVYIPFPSFTITNGTDCNNCILIGQSTYITGRLENYADLINVNLNSNNHSFLQIAPSFLPSQSPKIVWAFSATKKYVFVKKSTVGYVLMGFGKNQTTNGADSLATTTSDETRTRLVDVLNAVYVGLIKHTYSSISAAVWTEITVAATTFVNIIPPANSGRGFKYWQSSTADAWIEYQCKPKNGLISLAVYCGASGAAGAVLIEGVTYNVTTQGTAGFIRIYNFHVTTSDEEQITVRFTKDSSANTARIIGVQWRELKDWNGEEYDDFFYYRHTTNWGEYLTQSSANDCVIREYNSSVYGLSYHGGESTIVDKVFIDWQDVSLSLGQYLVGRHIEFRSSCTVNWSAIGGGSVDINSLWKIGDGSVSLEASLTGDLLCKELYTNMYGAPETFTKVIFPKLVDLTALADNSRPTFGKSNRIVLQNQTTGQRLTNQMSLYTKEQNQYGGIHIWKVTGTYHKIYYGMSLGGKYNLKNLGLTSVYFFE